MPTTPEPGRVHVTKYGTYHPDPRAEVAWTVHDTRGYIDPGPACDKCGICDCDPPCKDVEDLDPENECGGLAFAYVCLDGGEALCTECAEGEVEEVPCDCP